MGWLIRILGSFFIIIYLVLNYYVGLRSLQTLKYFFPSLKAIIFWIIFLVITLAYIADMAFGLNIPYLKMLGSYWIAAFFYLLILYFLIDIIGLVNAGFKFLPSSWTLFWESKKIYSIALVLTASTLIIGSWVAHNPQIVKYDVHIAKEVPGIQNLKVIMVSDLHIETFTDIGYLEEAAQTITSLKPDMIFLTGDIVESYLDAQTEEKLNKVLSSLEAKHGLYAVLGNHEYYGGQADKITQYFKDQGINILRDEITDSMNGSIYIVGRNDYRSGHLDNGTRKPLNAVFTGIDPAKPIILLDHQPKAVDEAREAGVDLMLSGHTHGGQLFPAQVVTKALFVIDRGIWQKDNFSLIVSTGLGLWGPPIKTSSKSEIVEINITFNKE